jgi:hypothetical protein
MWSDEIKKKMEEAEGAKTPAYNDKAWENMESLLDKHLPVERKRRRFIFFLLPLALAGGVAFFISQHKTTRIVPVTGQKNKVVQPSSTTDKSPSSAPDKIIDNAGDTPGETITPSKTETAEVQRVETAGENKLPARDDQVSSLPVSKQPYKQKEKPAYYPTNNNDRLAQPALKKKNNKPVPATNDDNNIVSGNEVNKNAPNTEAPGNKPTTVDNTTTNNTVANNPATPAVSDSQATVKDVVATDKKKEDTTAAVVKTNTKKQKSNTPNSRFSINLSFGPDVSSVGLDNPGRLKLQYGIGASYAISKRLTIRTGFFAAKKIYTADSSSYKTPYTIHNLKKIDANCLVYEIPLTLQYNFAAEKKHNWFIAGGLSSYLMKKETYGYYYKNPWGNLQFYERTYKNENTHLFSVINLSGGYQYNLSDRFFIMAEPYMKIPVSGVGVGKVKLNSAGVLFTAGFKPFVKRN